MIIKPNANYNLMLIAHTTITTSLEYWKLNIKCRLIVPVTVLYTPSQTVLKNNQYYLDSDG